jgi:hypothetical protein
MHIKFAGDTSSQIYDSILERYSFNISLNKQEGPTPKNLYASSLHRPAIKNTFIAAEC